MQYKIPDPLKKVRLEYEVGGFFFFFFFYNGGGKIRVSVGTTTDKHRKNKFVWTILSNLLGFLALVPKPSECPLFQIFEDKNLTPHLQEYIPEIVPEMM